MKNQKKNTWWKVEIEDDDFEIVLAKTESEAIDYVENAGHIVLWVEPYED